MADVECTVETLGKLKVADLDKDWVKSVWDSDFTDADPLPIATREEFDSDDAHKGNLQTLRKCLSPWMRGTEERGFWATLVENDISHRSLVAMLFHIMETGQKRTATAIQRQAGVAAGEVYCCLLALPGSGAFKVFHPLLFQKAVDSFKIWTKLDAPVRKRKSAPGKSDKSARAPKGRKRARGAVREEEEENPFADEEEEEEGEEELTPQEITAIHKSLRALLKTFVQLLETYSLKDNEQSTLECIQVLTSLVRIEPETFHGNFDGTTFDNACVVPQMAYKGLFHLCTSSRGAVAPVVTMVFKHLLPHLLMMGENKSVYATTIPQSVQYIKDHALAFVLYLVDRYGDPVLPPTRVLLQHVCVKVPDKVEYRTRVSAAMVSILRKLSTASYARMMDWIYKFSRNAKIPYRAFALSLVSLLLAEPERVPDANISAEYVGLLTHRFLVQMILSRCSDIAPTVRARAIQALATCCSAVEPLTQTAIKNLITPRPPGRPPVSRVVPTPDPTRTAAVTDQNASEDKDTTKPEDKENPLPPAAAADDAANVTPGVHEPPVEPAETPVTTNAPTPGGIILTPGGEISLIEGKGVISMLRRRAQTDERANVRKAALQALENLIRLDGSLLNSEDLSILNGRCSDPALSVRRQAMRSLTDLLNDVPLSPSLQKAWLDGVLPLVMDRESSAQEKCLEAIEEVIISNIVPYQRSKSDHHSLAWQLLTYLASPAAVGVKRYLQRACQQLGRGGKLKPSMVAYMQTHVGTANNTGVWMFLAALAPFMKIPHGFVVDYWNSTAKNSTASEGDAETVHRVLTVLGFCAKNIETEKAELIAEELKNRLMRFDSPPELIAVTANTLGKLCRAHSDSEAASQKVVDTYFTDLLLACDAYLSKVILDENPETPVDEEKTICHIFTLGEIAQLCPTKTPKRACMLVQSLVAAPVITSIDGSSQMPSTQTSTVSNHSSDHHSDQQSDRLSTQQTSGPRLDWPNSQFSQSSQGALSQFRGSKMSNRVRAFAFTTLGKLCLQNEDLAKKVVAALARELEVSTDPAVRNNVVIILCDLCVRYTSVVDRYISNISACLKDSSPIIRKQTLTLVTHLLQEDFLKWKGSLFFRFVTTLVDEYKEIREFAEFCLIHILLQRHPGMFFHHFIECVFHFNSYQGHASYNKFPQTDQEKIKFSLKGRANAAKRQKIYLFFLEHLTDEHRFTLTAKLTQEVLNAVVDDVMPINSETSALIQDALFILASKEIKLSVIRNPAVDEDAVEPQDMAAAVMNVAKKTLITQVMKKNVIENIVPTIISLKHRLETHHSPLLKDLMFYLRELVKDYKTEVKDIMSADRQLANEIEFDLRKFEEQQDEERRRQEQAAARAACVGSPAGSPLIQGSPVISPGGRQRSPQTGSPRPRQTGSPRPRSPQPAPGTPRTPAPANPKSPCLNLATKGTPMHNRRTSISTLAIMNSARKAMEKARRVSVSARSSTEGTRASTEGTRASTDSTRSSTDGAGNTKRVGWADEASTSKALTEQIDSSANVSSPGFTTPKQHRGRPTISRAISTPAANLSVLGDITFHQGDLSLIPGTPTASEDHLGSPGVGSQGKKKAPSDVIHLMSPDQPRSKPRTWNIKSPAPDPVKTRLLPSDESDGPDTSPPTSKADDNRKKTREVLVPRRSSRGQGQQVAPPAQEDSENETFTSLNRSGSRRRSTRRK